MDLVVLSSLHSIRLELARSKGCRARERGFEESNEITEMELRRYWMTRGLRLAGTKTNRPAPLLAEFVRRVLLPDPRNVRGVVIWG